MRATWIRRWFLRQDDFTLWIIFLVWCFGLFGFAIWLVTTVALLVTGVEA
jgi:hypothetical protein